MWRPFDNGRTLGLKGSESGETIRDEEYISSARITLEKNGVIAPFSITCGIYGWMAHTRFFATNEEAVAEYDKMKTSLSKIVEQVNDKEYKDCRTTEVIEAMEAFVETYP
jgi:hypothetical protein